MAITFITGWIIWVKHKGTSKNPNLCITQIPDTYL